MYKKKLDIKKIGSCLEVVSHYKDKDGYVILKEGSVAIKAHRFIYEQMFGFIPNGLIVRHKCDNPSCVNPEHLKLGTHQDNMNDKMSRGRYKRGKGSEKLTKGQVIEIRQKYKPRVVTHNMLAKEYGVARSTIGAIIRKENWLEV